MATCEYHTSCLFFNKMVKEMPHTEQLRDKYCNGKFSECARFKISRSYGMFNVPTFIFPNDFL
jgi:hypothetical protein